MRTFALDILAIIAAAVFVVMVRAEARHRSAHPPGTSPRSSAWADYLFALVPWLIIVASALPSLRRIAAGD